MPLAGNELDANFFNLIHRVLAEQKKASHNRRSCDRRAYEAFARIALPRGLDLPDEAEFFEVQCQDLTRRGCSFLLPYCPDFGELIISFGAPPNAIYLAAQVVHCDDVLILPNGHDALPVDETELGDTAPAEAQPMVRVGCQFLDRLHR